MLVEQQKNNNDVRRKRMNLCGRSTSRKETTDEKGKEKTSKVFKIPQKILSKCKNWILNGKILEKNYTML